MNNVVRNAFEEWAKEDGFFDLSCTGSVYTTATTRCAWEVWQAATFKKYEKVPVDVRASSMYSANLHTIECFVEIARELRSRAEPYLESIDEGGCASQDECSVHFDRMFHCVEIALQNIRPTYCDPMESERAAFEIYRAHSLARDEYGSYENTVTADDWAMWQAACRHMKNKEK